jgi:GNAT superfamily N-acetyltransferase
MITDSGTPTVRTAGPADVDAVVATLTTAFFDDPLWGPAFPDVERRAEQASAFWRMFVVSGQRYPWTLVTENAESAALWVPPGGTELTAEEADGVEAFLVDLTGPAVAKGILDLFEQFDMAHPHDEPHFFLNLLGTHDAHRGKGLGMALLRENLARIDEIGAPVYLESSNPANIARYESVGFEVHGGFTVAATGHPVTTMWRSGR